MAAEFLIRFSDPDWKLKNVESIKDKIRVLPTFSTERVNEFWLAGSEKEAQSSQWDYDVRLIFSADAQILVEISGHPASIEQNLAELFNWLRGFTAISVENEDGDRLNW